MKELHIITGSSRDNSAGTPIANWVAEAARATGKYNVNLINLRDENLPFINEPMPPMMGNYQNDSTKNWAAKITKADAYIVVSPEYNHSYPGIVKNAFDTVYSEWGDKPAGIVTYSATPGAGLLASEHLRGLMTFVKLDVSDDEVNIGTVQDANLRDHDESLQKLLTSIAA